MAEQIRTYVDSEGATLICTPSEFRKHQDKLRKRRDRAAMPEVVLPFPRGTAEALDRVLKAAGFDDRRDFLAFQIHRLADLLEADRPAFDAQARRTVRLGDMSHYLARVGGEPAEGDEYEDLH